MENIGIIRRVDDLGRIVIPKEMRSNLMIKSGDCVEVFQDKEKIFLLKQDVLSNRLGSIDNILNIISKTLNCTILITDTDKYINVYGKGFGDYIGKKIDNNLYKKIVKRENIINEKINIDGKYLILLLKPLILNGDAIGSIIMTRNDNTISEIDKVCVQIVEKLFLSNLEN